MTKRLVHYNVNGQETTTLRVSECSEKGCHQPSMLNAAPDHNNSRHMLAMCWPCARDYFVGTAETLYKTAARMLWGDYRERCERKGVRPVDPIERITVDQFADVT